MKRWTQPVLSYLSLSSSVFIRSIPWPSGGLASLRCLAFLALWLPCGCSKPGSRDAASAARLSSAIFSHVEIIGTRGTGAGEFNKPRSLAVDANDNVYVVDMTGRVQKFSPEGKFLLSWQMPQTDLGKPKGMCRDRDGNIVVLEPHYQRVNHFTTEGRLVARWGVHGTNVGELTLPRAVAVDTKGSVLVSEYTLVDRVQKFSAYGRKCLDTWGTPGVAPGEFNRGRSLLPILRGQAPGRRSMALGWELHGSRALRDGDWKLLWDAGEKRWELYDLATDRTETIDVAEKHPERVRAMETEWREWARKTEAPVR
jgi:hypothetical protein